MILVNMQKFYVIGFSTFRDMTSQKFPFQKEMRHCNLIFTPWNRGKLEKKSLLCLKASFLAQSYSPPAFPWFPSKTKNSYVQASAICDVSFQKQLQQPPGESILLKFCQNVSNKN